MGTETEHVETIHGPVEYETVECVNCEQSKVPEKAVDVVVGDAIAGWEDLSNHAPHIGVATPKHDGFPPIENMCEDCANSIFGYDLEGGVTDYHTDGTRIVHFDKALAAYALLMTALLSWVVFF